MSDGEALLRAILERPEEDTPRLVYADWLEDVEGGNDAARAEFVRVQCEYHRTPACEHLYPWAVTDCRKCELRRQEQVLLGSQQAIRWRALGYGQAPRWDMRRGFIAELLCTLASFMKHAKVLFESNPIERVTLTDRQRPSRFYYAMGAVGAMWRLEADSPADEHAVLPESLYMHLHAEMNYLRECGYVADTYDRAAAFARKALSDACVAYGRSLAGLSQLVSA